MNFPDADADLLATATRLLAEAHTPGRHEVAAAMRGADGRIHTGVHVEGSARRTSICAEGIALGSAITAGARDITTIVAVHYKPADRLRVIAPCGVCRDLMFDYCPDAHVYVYEPPAGELPDGTMPGGGWEPGTALRLPVSDLMPYKTRRRW
ncbi:cytidine deaminase [Actinocorallia herbida]|uniref:Cytidine deaminase n=1 Tax=Actinocorallia herbida TaxID=58109 RepID=A0A3N1D6G5_9ACTN|nr:hypothetical protein [Actinocorallia herbida]ROO89122.1 cytidine deaminase [Actinocorallia herbida]